MSIWSGCSASSSTGEVTQWFAGSDKLYAGERLFPTQGLASGNTQLVYQSDGNLVLRQGDTPIWASNCWPTCNDVGVASSFEMQTDCNAVVYATTGYVWASWTNGIGNFCHVQVSEGDWAVCNATNRVFSARGGGVCDTPRGYPDGISGYQGCFTDDSNRALPLAQGSGYSVAACIERCRGLGTVYAGLQWYGHCFCGNVAGYTRVRDEECNTPCNVGGGICGGAWRNSIFGAAASGQCTTDANCPPDKVCIAFSCVSGPACRTDSECFPGEKCSGSTCVPAYQQPECESDWDCPGANQVCDTGKCRAVYASHTECTTNNDCNVGCFCRSNACWCYE